jgi:DNA-binding transcriptional MerR regulator
LTEWVPASVVCKETGATLRQLQWWDEHGIQRAHRDVALRRYYSPRQVRLITIVVVLISSGTTMGPRRAFVLAKALDSSLIIQGKKQNQA